LGSEHSRSAAAAHLSRFDATLQRLIMVVQERQMRRATIRSDTSALIARLTAMVEEVEEHLEALPGQESA
jgi:hypothetical protein